MVQFTDEPAKSAMRQRRDGVPLWYSLTIVACFICFTLLPQSAYGSSQTATTTETASSLNSSSVVFRWNETARLAHLVGVLASTRGRGSERNVSTVWINVNVAVYLAVQHFNRRLPVVVKDLTQLLGGCDIQLSLEFLDTRQDPIEGPRQVLPTLNRAFSASYPNATTTTVQTFTESPLPNPPPAAFVGTIQSVVSETVSILTGVFGLPMISPSATSAELDDKSLYPLFGRTRPTSDTKARALVNYFYRLGVRQFGMIFVQDTVGFAYQSATRNEANRLGMSVKFVRYKDGDEASARKAVFDLADSKVTYFFGVLSPSMWKFVFKTALGVGLAGNDDHLWILSSGGASMFQEQPNMYLEDRDLFRAVLSAGYIDDHAPVVPELETAYDEFYAPTPDGRQQREEFLQLHENRDFLRANRNDVVRPTRRLASYEMAYDAVMALGLAMCQLPNEFFSGTEIYDELRHNVVFEGASGGVKFNPETGSRDLEGVEIALWNMQARGDDLKPVLSSLLTYHQDSLTIETISPYIYWDGSTEVPDPLPPFGEGLRLIPGAELAVGYTICALAVLLSVGWSVFTFWYRSRKEIRMAQPVFLYMTCTGTFIIAITIIPLAQQEPSPTSALDVACMARLWTASFGFTTSFSALFCKMWRLNKLLGSAKAFRRIKVTPIDVLLPFAMLLSCNTILLVTWSLVDPLRWTRTPVPGSVDSLSRPTATVGSCRSKEAVNEVVFYTVLFAINLCALLFANRESYKGRNHPKRYRATNNAEMTMLSVLELAIIGFPILFLLGGDPTMGFLATSILIGLLCTLILLPTFLPICTHIANRKTKGIGSSRTLRSGMSRPSAHVSSNHGPKIRLDSNPKGEEVLSNQAS